MRAHMSSTFSGCPSPRGIVFAVLPSLFSFGLAFLVGLLASSTVISPEWTPQPL